MHHHMPHAHFHGGQELAKRDIATVISVVYVTADPTFSGPIAGYKTLEEESSTTSTTTTQSSSSPEAATSTLLETPIELVPTSTTSERTSTSSSQRPVQTSLQRVQISTNTQSTSTSTIVIVPSSTVATSLPPTSLAASSVATNTPSASTTVNGITSASSTPTESTFAPVTSDGAQGMSGGAKAGLAFGILALIGLVLALVVFMFRRKKAQNERHEKLPDEKGLHHQPQMSTASAGSLGSHVSVRKSNTLAPRLSLRPLTQMFPRMEEKHDGPSGSAFLVPAATAGRSKTPEPAGSSGAEFNHNGNPHDLANPFGDHAAAFNHGQTSADHVNQPFAVVPKPLNIRSGSSGNSSVNGVRTITGQNASATPPTAPTPASRQPTGPSNVHRVHIEFIPSMDDELELRPGQLVRMLHEYDDGWALCIRLDRSQQGVVPRTCISKLPVKPRPARPAPGIRGALPVTPSQGASHQPAAGSVSSTASSTSLELQQQIVPTIDDPTQASTNGFPAAQDSGSRSRSNSSSVSRKPVPGQAL